MLSTSRHISLAFSLLRINYLTTLRSPWTRIGGNRPTPTASIIILPLSSPWHSIELHSYKAVGIRCCTIWRASGWWCDAVWCTWTASDSPVDVFATAEHAHEQQHPTEGASVAPPQPVVTADDVAYCCCFKATVCNRNFLWILNSFLRSLVFTMSVAIWSIMAVLRRFVGRNLGSIEITLCSRGSDSRSESLTYWRLAISVKVAAARRRPLAYEKQSVLLRVSCWKNRRPTFGFVVDRDFFFDVVLFSMYIVVVVIVFDVGLDFGVLYVAIELTAPCQIRSNIPTPSIAFGGTPADNMWLGLSHLEFIYYRLEDVLLY